VIVSLKIDVDTKQGYLEGVPRLAETLGELGAPATFCVAMGPDCSGRALRRFFTKRGFLSKMLRTRALSTYGWRTVLYGTLLPAPLITASDPQILRDLDEAGFEVIPHGWDHVSWHDFLTRWGPERTREEFDKACAEYEKHLGRPCHAFASPGWQATDASLLVEEERGLVYSADVRGWRPFFPLVAGRRLSVLQLPTTLPTVDELLGRRDLAGMDARDYLLDLLRKPPTPLRPADSAEERASRPDAGPTAAGGQPTGAGAIHVFTLHAEVEGGPWLEQFRYIVARLQDEGVRFMTLRELAQAVQAGGEVPAGRVVMGTLPGRAGQVAYQEGYV